MHVPKIAVALLDFFLNIWFISFSVDNSFSFVHCAFDFLFFFFKFLLLKGMVNNESFA